MADRSAPHPLGTSAQTHWLAGPERIDMAQPAPAPRPLTLASTPQQVTLDLERSVLMVIDMQNDFCSAGGWVDHLGADYRPDRAPIEPLRRLLPAWRGAGGRVLWVNWGNRPDLANMPPNQHHLYKPLGQGIGLGEPLPGHGARVLEKDSWAAAVVDELADRGAGHPRRQAPHQRLLGHAARLDPAQPRRRGPSSSPASTPTSACCAR